MLKTLIPLLLTAFACRADDGPWLQAQLDNCAVVKLSRRVYHSSQGLIFRRPGQQLVGASPVYAYSEADIAATTIVFEGGMLDGVTMGTEGGVLQDLALDGAGVRATGTQLIRHVQVKHALVGVRLADYTNSTRLDGVALVRNQIGLVSEGLNTSTWGMSHSRVRDNSSHGIQLSAGQAVEISNTVIEANGGYGAYIADSIPSLSYVNEINFRSVWFEANANPRPAVDQYQVIIDGVNTRFVEFHNCMFSLGTTPNQRAIHVVRSRDIFVERSNFRGMGDSQNYFVLEPEAVRTRFLSIDLLEAVNPQTPAQLLAMGTGTIWQP